MQAICNKPIPIILNAPKAELDKFKNSFNRDFEEEKK